MRKFVCVLSADSKPFWRSLLLLTLGFKVFFFFADTSRVINTERQFWCFYYNKRQFQLLKYFLVTKTKQLLTKSIHVTKMVPHLTTCIMSLSSLYPIITMFFFPLEKYVRLFSFFHVTHILFCKSLLFTIIISFSLLRYVSLIVWSKKS